MIVLLILSMVNVTLHRYVQPATLILKSSVNNKRGKVEYNVQGPKAMMK